MKEPMKKTPIAEILSQPIVRPVVVAPKKEEPATYEPEPFVPRRKIQFVIRRFGK